jgi:small subunit ribosomal protein S19e
MITVRDVDSGKLNKLIAEELKKTEIKPHELANMVKSGIATEHPPSQEDFWYLRSAAILRKVYLNPKPVGTERLRNCFGGRKNNGHQPSHHYKAGGKFIRLMLQQLEKEGLVKKSDKQKKGRTITPKGQKLLDSLAKKVDQ